MPSTRSSTQSLYSSTPLLRRSLRHKRTSHNHGDDQKQAGQQVQGQRVTKLSYADSNCQGSKKFENLSVRPIKRAVPKADNHADKIDPPAAIVFFPGHQQGSWAFLQLSASKSYISEVMFEKHLTHLKKHRCPDTLLAELQKCNITDYVEAKFYLLAKQSRRLLSMVHRFYIRDEGATDVMYIGGDFLHQYEPMLDFGRACLSFRSNPEASVELYLNKEWAART